MKLLTLFLHLTLTIAATFPDYYLDPSQIDLSSFSMENVLPDIMIIDEHKFRIN